MQVEDSLAAALTDVDDDSIVVEACLLCRLGDELQHPLGLVRGKLPDLAKARHVPLRDDEQMDVGSGIDVADRDEALGLRNVLALREELAEEAVLRQRRSPPP